MRRSFRCHFALVLLVGAGVVAVRARGDDVGEAGVAKVAPAPADQPLNPMTDPPQLQVMPVALDYDRFQDKSTLRVEGIRPTITKGMSRLFINATCSFDGQTIAAKPAKVQLTMLAVSDEYQFADIKDDLQLIFLIACAPAPAPTTAASQPVSVPLPRSLQIDNPPPPAPASQPSVQRVRIPVRFLKAGTTKGANSKCLESFVAIMDADVLSKVVEAPLVEGQLGGTEFKFGDAEKQSLHHLAEQAKLIAPASPEAPGGPQVASNLPLHVDSAAVHLAQAKVDAAQEKVNAATDNVLSQLQHDKGYQQAAKAAADLEAKKDSTPAGPQRTQISQQWLEARAKVNLLKSSAMLEDPAMIAARNELVDAQNALHALEAASGKGREGER